MTAGRSEGMENAPRSQRGASCADSPDAHGTIKGTSVKGAAITGAGIKRSLRPPFALSSLELAYRLVVRATPPTFDT